MIQKISAKNIKSAQYYPMRMILEIQFYGDTNVYQYLDVPEDVWYGMRNTLSVDMFFNMQIMSRYKQICKTKFKNKDICE